MVEVRRMLLVDGKVKPAVIDKLSAIIEGIEQSRNSDKSGAIKYESVGNDQEYDDEYATPKENWL